MAWVTPVNRSTGDLITATIWNQDVVSNPAALRGGAIAVASQAANDFMYFSTTTQIGRLAASTNKVPFFNNSSVWEMKGLGGLNRCRVYNNAVQAIVTSTPSTLTFNSEAFDTNALHDTSSNTGRITVPTGGDGVWLFIASAQWSGATGGVQRLLELRKNGTTIKAGSNVPPVASTAAAHQQAVIIDMVATDYMEARVTHDQGSNMNLGDGTDTNHWFSACQLG